MKNAEYVDSIIDDVRWLGGEWEDRLFYASDYFGHLYEWAIQLIKEGKGATHYGIASAIARICQAIVHNSDLILSVAVVHAEVEGVPEVCVSLPMLVNAKGAQLVAYPELNATEREALRHSAHIVKEATEKVLAAR